MAFNGAFAYVEEREARKKWRSWLSCKSQPLLHGGALGEAPVWRWSRIRRLTPVGPAGPPGIQGPEGPPGTVVEVETQGTYAFSVDEKGHLILHYTGDTAPDFSINEKDGHLYLNIA